MVEITANCLDKTEVDLHRFGVFSKVTGKKAKTSTWFLPAGVALLAHIFLFAILDLKLDIHDLKRYKLFYNTRYDSRCRLERETFTPYHKRAFLSALKTWNAMD